MKWMAIITLFVASLCVGQPMPPQIQRKAHAVVVKPSTNQPVERVVRVTTKPFSARIMKSKNLGGPWQSWSNSPATDKPDGTAFYRARGEMQVEWNRSANATSYSVVVWQAGIPGWWECPVGDTNRISIPAFFEGSNNVAVYAMDDRGNISGFSNKTNCVIPRPEISIQITTNNNK